MERIDKLIQEVIRHLKMIDVLIFEVGTVPFLNDLIILAEQLQNECFGVKGTVQEESGEVVGRYDQGRVYSFLHALFEGKLVDGKDVFSIM